MRHFKLFGLCLSVALAACAIAAASASAGAPIFNFSGETETFSSKGGALKLETTKGEVVKCETMIAKGTVENVSLSEVKAFSPVFNGCTAKVGAEEYNCQSAGAAKGEIKTSDLGGKLGWLHESKEEVGILLSPESGLFAEFECVNKKIGGKNISVKIKGSVIGKITPVNTSVGPTETTKAFEVKFTKGSSMGEPGIKNFEGEAENKLETEDTFTEKEKVDFIGSALEGSFEIFPEVRAHDLVCEGVWRVV